MTFSDLPNSKSDWVIIDDNKNKHHAKLVNHVGSVVTLSSDGFFITLDVKSHAYHIDCGYEREI